MSAMLACSLIPGAATSTATPTAASISAVGTARELTSGESASGRLKAGGTDIYSVKAAEGEALKLDIDIEGNLTDIQVGVADSTGKAIATQTSQSGKRLTVVTGPLTAGDYTVTLTNTGADETPYAMTVTTGDPAVIGGAVVESTPEASATDATGSVAVTALPGSSAAADAGTGQTACDHPYFPMRPGSTWTYNLVAETSATYTMVVTDVTGDTESAEATMTMTMQDLVITYTWTCTRTGGLQSFEYGMGGIASGIGAVTETTGEGVFLPAEDQLTTNASWTYSSNGTMSMDAGGVSMEGSSAMTAVNTVVGLDGQTDVQATTLGGIMSVLTEQTIEVNFGGVAAPATETRSTLMFARGIGLVSSASAGDGIYSSSTLVSYSIP